MEYDIDLITEHYGGIAYEQEVSDEMIEQSIKNKRYDTNLYIPGHSHADRIAGMVIKILIGASFPIEVWYRSIDPYIWTIYDGNHRLRAYQYLKKDMPIYLMEE